jgi:hypothetical protein
MTSQALFGMSIAFSFGAWGCFVQRYIWPALRDKPRADALQPLLLLHAFRFIGLAFLVPGVVSPDLPRAFAHPAAWGDLIAAALALLALLALRSPVGLGAVWIFNVWGTVDLLHASYQGRIGVGLDPGQLGAAYFIPTLVVPLLLITHGLVFRLLLRRSAVASSPARPRAA